MDSSDVRAKFQRVAKLVFSGLPIPFINGTDHGPGRVRFAERAIDIESSVCRCFGAGHRHLRRFESEYRSRRVRMGEARKDQSTIRILMSRPLQIIQASCQALFCAFPFALDSAKIKIVSSRARAGRGCYRPACRRKRDLDHAADRARYLPLDRENVRRLALEGICPKVKRRRSLN